MRSPSSRRALGAWITAVAGLAALQLTPAPRASEPIVPIPAGKVDSGLRALVEAGGYDDDSFYRALEGHRAGDVYYLARLDRRPEPGTIAALRAAGARVRHTYRAVTWVALASPAGRVGAVASLPQVQRLEPDLVHEVLVESDGDPAALLQGRRGTGDIGADHLWDLGVTGASVTVGVADTGTDGTHPDLDDLDFRSWDEPGDGKLQFFVDCVGGSGAGFVPTGCRPVPSYDDHGHGTHVSGIATGSAEGGGEDQRGLFPGVAPGASLAVAKVLSGAGTGLNSDVLMGFEALATETEAGGAGADVINASLGSGRFYGAPISNAEQVSHHENAAAELVNALAEEHNVVFVISAGNSGPMLQSIGSPGVAAQALTVGASITDFDLDAEIDDTAHGEWGHVRDEAAAAGASAIADFSSRGPSGDRLIKPDITAPGVYWVGPESSEGAELKALDFGHRHAYSDDPTYAVLSGTSMSSPAAAGAAALVIDGWNKATQSQPWRYHEVKAALVNTAGDSAFEGPVSGSVGTITTKVGGQTPNEVYPLRHEAWVGVAGEGAGRIHAGRAIVAMTRGITAFTPQDGELDDVHELQPSWSLDELLPGESSWTTFLLRSGPLAVHDQTTVTWSAAEEAQPQGVQSIPSSWLTLPGTAPVPRGGHLPVGLRVDVPAGATPGLYGGVVTARADLGGGVVQSVRIPVQLYVALADTDPAEGGTTAVIDRTDLWASAETDYSYLGSRHPLEGDIFTDWLAYPVRLPADVQSVTAQAHDPEGADGLDLFVFDDNGVEIDSTASPYLDRGLPGNMTTGPSSADSPAEVTLLDGDDNPGTEVGGGDTVWVVVSLTTPSAPATFRAFHLEVDVVGGGVVGETAPAERIHSGAHAWWGGSTGDADHHMTKAVTVPVGEPTLSFWTWYELEDGYDWAFVLVSADGGTTWENLPTTGANGEPGTTDENPIEDFTILGGNKPYPNGFTGVSGTDPSFSGQQLESATYVEQVADLSDHAGQEVLLRFVYTSDAGTDWAGFYVDDITVTGSPTDTAESPAGWDAVGFTHVVAPSM